MTRRIRKYTSCTSCTGHGNDFELIPTVRMESQHSIGSPACHDFPRFVIISEKSRLIWSRKSLTVITAFWKKDPLWQNFHKCFRKRFTISQIHVLYANVVKFGWTEIGKVVRYLLDQKKTKFPLALPLSLPRESRLKYARASSRQ